MTPDLRTTIVHPFLFALSPIVFIFSSIHQIPINYLLIPVLLALTVVSFLFILLKFLFKNWAKAGIVLSFLLIMFMLYGYLHEKLFGINVGGINVGSYTTLTIPFVIIFILGIYYLIRIKNKLNSISTVFNVASVVLMIFIIAHIGVNNLEDSRISYSENFEVLELSNTGRSNHPDIYYIILDEYAGAESLQMDFNFDNSEFYSALSKRGFYVQPTSYSNYAYTMLSVPSALNMQYLNSLGDELGSESTNVQPIIDVLQNNLVMKNLKSEGYHIASFYAGANAEGSAHLVDEKLCGNEYYINELKGLVVRFTPISYFIGSQSPHHDKKDEILCTFSEIPKVGDRVTKPVFVYAHIMIPHEPYVFDKDGNRVTFYSDTDESTKKMLYLEQLEFANKKTIEVIDAILTNSHSPPVIIIQSDHGERTGIDWRNPSKEMIRQAFNNLNAYHLPNNDGSSLYDGITPVNSFRVIFNEYFNADFELLDDRSYWIESDEKPYDLRDITEILNEYR